MAKSGFEDIDLTKALDYAKRDYEIDNDHGKYGYEIKDKVKNKNYSNYLSNNYWKSFLTSMSKLHQAQYRDGDGGELNEKNGRYGMNPPKMASFGSSSRFIYLLSKDIAGFTFEKQFPTRVGHTANLDGFLIKDSEIYCIEAKCREIYSSHKNIKISIIYEDVYSKISNLSFRSIDINNDIEHKKYTFSYNGNVLVHFDIKQLICHFLGIAADILENRQKGCTVHFVYLIFNPNNNTLFSAETKRYEEKIYKAYEETIKEINLFGDMSKLFDSIMKYQISNLNLSPIEYSFDFKVVDQNNYNIPFK